MNDHGSYKSHFQKAKAARSTPPRTKNMTEEEVEAQLRKAFGMKATPSSQNRSIRKKSIRAKNQSGSYSYPVIALAAMFIGISSYLSFPEEFEALFSKIEISYMGAAQAKDEGKKSPSEKPSKEEKPSASSKAQVANEASSVSPVTAEELSYLGKLRERKAELDLREAELNQLEEELQRQKSEIEVQIAELSKIREEISAKLEDRVEADEGKVKKLVELYSSMKPKQAAKIIETVNTDLAVEVLANMKKKSAADIMNVMDEKVAKELSERLTGYKRTPANLK